MKNLLDYIKESIEVDEAKGSEEENVNVPDSKTFSFNFKDFDDFNEGDGVIHRHTKHTVRKTKIEPTDEFIKVSKYLNTIFAYKNIVRR